MSDPDIDSPDVLVMISGLEHPQPCLTQSHLMVHGGVPDSQAVSNLVQRATVPQRVAARSGVPGAMSRLAGEANLRCVGRVNMGHRTAPASEDPYLLLLVKV